MKTLSSPSVSGTSRFLKGVIAIVGLAAAAPAFAAPQGTATAFLAGEQFGANKEIHVTSENRKLTKAKRYTYTLSGKLKVPKGSPLAKVVPSGVSLATFIESLSPGGSSFLTRTADNPVENPSRNLPLTLVNKTFAGTKTVAGVGTVKISLTVVGKILADGTLVMDVTDVKIKSTPQANFGTVQFLTGSKIVVTAAPEVEFKKTNTVVSETAGSVSIPVWRTTNTKGPASVQYQVKAGGTASPSDYTIPGNTTVSFGTGETTKNIVIPINNNALNDGGRFFEIELINPGSGAVLGGSVPGSRLDTKVTITDED